MEVFPFYGFTEQVIQSGANEEIDPIAFCPYETQQLAESAFIFDMVFRFKYRFTLYTFPFEESQNKTFN